MIIFIDDEKRRMSSYAEELELSLKQEVQFETDVESALVFLDNPKEKIDLIILDVMMSPGKTFQNQETEYGLKTGLLLYRRIRSQNKTVPIVIFTNATDSALQKEVKHDKRCTFWQKSDLLPYQFSNEIEKFMNK